MLDITIDLNNIALFLLLFCRVGGTMIAAPLIGSARVPARLKAGLALAISFVLAPVAGDSFSPPGAVALALAAGGEILLGLAMGFGASLIFATIQMAGEMADMQAAFGFAGVVSPQTGERNSVIGQLQVSVAWLIFLAANGHHLVLRGIGGSLAALPLGGPPGFSAPALTNAFAGLLGTSICIAAPTMAAVILTDFALGMLTRAAPQMNLLAIGFPIKLAVGLAAALLSLPILASAQRGLISTLDTIVRSIIAASGWTRNMAEERTEQATPKRREDARKRGEIPRSTELAGAAALLGALLGLRFGWTAAITQSHASALFYLRTCPGWEPTIGAATGVIRTALLSAASITIPLVAGASIAALAVNLAQSRFLISVQPLALKWSRLSLTQGLARIFSRQGVFSVLRSLVKLALILAVTFLFLRSRGDAVLGLAHGTPLTAAAGLGRLLWGLLIRIAGVLALVAAADYVFQHRQHESKLRMTRHEQREEHKQSEGDPLVRSRVREQQRALARHRMMEAVKHAAVVVTNPVEIAVAIRYEAATTPAPIVVAKGRRLLGERIKAEAIKHGIPVTPSRDLARALYRSVPIGRQIPPDLYQAVAEILAFVYRLTGRPPR